MIEKVSFSAANPSELIDSAFDLRFLYGYPRAKTRFSPYPLVLQVSVSSSTYSHAHPILKFSSRWIRFSLKKIGLTVGMRVGEDRNSSHADQRLTQRSGRPWNIANSANSPGEGCHLHCPVQFEAESGGANDELQESYQEYIFYSIRCASKSIPASTMTSSPFANAFLMRLHLLGLLIKVYPSGETHKPLNLFYDSEGI